MQSPTSFQYDTPGFVRLRECIEQPATMRSVELKLTDPVWILLLDGQANFRQCVIDILSGDAQTVRANLNDYQDRSGHPAFTEIDTACVALNNEVDEQKLDAWLNKLIALPHDERSEHMQSAFVSLLQNNPDHFYNVVVALAERNIPYMVINAHLDEVANGENPFIDALQFDHQLFLDLIHVYQELKESESVCAQIFMSRVREGAMADRKSAIVQDGDPINTLGAALPDMSAKVTRFRDAVARLKQERLLDSMSMYVQLRAAFQQSISPAFGENMQAFFTGGTTDTFKDFVTEFDKAYPDAKYIYPPGEYLPLVHKMPEDRRVQLPLESTGFSEQQYLDSVQDEIAERTQEGEQPPQLFIMLSSVPRRGGNKLDMDKIIDGIRQLERTCIVEKRLPSKRFVHIIVDASQDDRIIEGADVVFYSKRITPSRSGAAVINVDRYPTWKCNLQDENPERAGARFQEPFRDRKGFEIENIATILAAFQCLQTRSFKTIADVPDVPNLLNLRFRGKYLKHELRHAQEYVDSSEVLRSQIRLVIPDLKDHESSAIVRIEPVGDAFRRGFITDLAAGLRDQNVAVSTTSIDDLEHADARITDLIDYVLLPPERFSPSDYKKKARALDDYFQESFHWPLLPPVDTDDQNELRDHLMSCLQYHRAIRMLLTINDPPEKLLQVLKRAETVLTSLS